VQFLRREACSIFSDKKDAYQAPLCYRGKKLRMDAWMGIGFFLLGLAVGALLNRNCEPRGNSAGES